jgi:hypothetical protein
MSREHTVTKEISVDNEVTVGGTPWGVDKKWGWHYPWVALLNGGWDGVVLSGFESNNKCSFERRPSIWSRITIIAISNSRRCFGFWHSLRLRAINSNCAAKRPNR